MNKIRAAIFLVRLSLIPFLFGTAQAQRPSIITPTEPTHLVESALFIPERYKSRFEDRAYKLWMPEGFKASLYCGIFDGDFGWSYPRLMGLDSNNVVHYAEAAAHEIRAIIDRDQDGTGDTIITVAKNLDSLHSFSFYKGALYAALASSIRKLTDKDGDGFFESDEAFITGLPSYGPFNHWTRTIVFDEISRKLYVSVGTSCDACRQPDSLRSAILEFNDDGTGRRVYASGLRNAVGLAIHPETRKLWATNADRNKLGDDYPEEILTSIKDGGFYGWPIAYGIRDWTDFAADPEYTSMLPITKEDSLKVESMEIADYFLSAHSTPFGIHFYRGDQFPTNYRTGYVCVKGSSDSRSPHGYKIQRFWEENGQNKIADFAVGFSEDSLDYKIWARPLAVVEDREGSLYVVLDHMRTMMKITYDKSDVNRTRKEQAVRFVHVEREGSRYLQILGSSLSAASVQMGVYSLAGQKILSTHLTASPNGNSVEIPLPALSTGVYLCRIKYGEELVTGSFNVR